MKKSLSWGVFIVVLGLSPSGLAQDVTLNTNVDIESAVSTREGDFQKAEIMFQPELNVGFENGFSLTSIARFRGDIFDELEPKDRSQDHSSDISKRLLIGDHAEVSLRELYIDGFHGDVGFRLGKQQVVWGQADGIKVLDVVNPQSFREFVLDDFDDSRIPLWTANIEVPVGDESALQMLWIPDLTYSDLPESDGLYNFTSPRLVAPVNSQKTVLITETDKPDNPLKDGDFGARFSTFFKGWDVTFNYLYHYQDIPVFYQEETSSAISITSQYERSHLLGGTLSTAFDDYVFRSEYAYSTDKYYPASVSSAVSQFNEFSYVVGLDYRGFEDLMLSGQFFQSILDEQATGLTRDRFDQSVTFLAEKTFLNETWTAEVLFIHSINDGDGVMRPKVSHEWSDHVNLWIGADVFYGDQEGLWGQFNDLDRIYLGVEIGL